MPNGTFFIHECPICGRRLQVRVEYLGSRVSCRHCGGTFELSPSAEKPASNRPILSLLERAEHLLALDDPRELRHRP